MQVTNGAYTPLVLQSANTGKQTVYLRHNAVVDPITAVKTYAAVYSGVYGGADSSANDFNTLKAKGFASSSANANNDDGLYAGLVVEMDYDVSTGSQFDPSRIGSGGGGGSNVFIYGDGVGSSTDGIDLSSAFALKAAAMVKENAGSDSAPGSPVDSQIGKSGDATLGDRCKLYYRFYLESAATTGGVVQFDIVYSYSYTA